LDIDAVAAELSTRADVSGWARVIGADLLPPRLTDPTVADTEGSGDIHAGVMAPPNAAPMPPSSVLRRVPADPDAYERWRQLWAELAADPDIDFKEFANLHGISVRQVQWIRSVGATGLLNSPIPPAVRMAEMARANGHLPHEPIPAS
jgi:hypothetical protein